MSLTEILFWFVFVGGLVVALFRPVVGVFLSILIYAVNPETQWWGERIAALDLRISFIIACVTGVSLILNWRPMRGTESQFSCSYVMMLVFLVYCFFMDLAGVQPPSDGSSQERLDKLMRIIVFIFMMIRLVRTSAQYRWLLWSWLAGATYIGYQAWSGVGSNVGGRLSSGLGGPDFNQSSGLAAHMVPMIAFAGFIFYSSKSKMGKLLALIAAALAINTIILTRTRNAFPGTLVLILFGLLRLPKGIRLRCVLGIIVGSICALQLTDQGWWSRMATLRNPQKDVSIARRYDYWAAAVAMANEHPWGVGLGNFRNFVPYYITDLTVGRSAHSTYFQCLAELGYPGLILYLCIIVAAFYQFERARSIGKGWRNTLERNPEAAEEQRILHLLATANEVAVTGFLVCSAFTSRLCVEGLWVMLAMSACLYNIAEGVRRRSAGVQATEETRAPSALLVQARPCGSY